MSMTTTRKTRIRLDLSQKMQVIALIARGDTYAQINDFLQKKYGVQVNPNTIAQFKKTHADTIAVMQREHQDAEAADAATLLTRSRRLLGRKLSRAETDQAKLDEVDRKYRDSVIDAEDWRRQRTGLIELSVQELTSVSREMNAQSQKLPDAPPGLPAGAGNLGATEVLLNAIKSGNAVEIQRLILHPNDKS